MENRQLRTLAMFERVSLFLRQHVAELASPLAESHAQALEDVIAQVNALHGKQETAMLGYSGAAVRWKRDQMRRTRLKPLVRIAKPLFRFAPGVEHLLRVPHASASSATIASHALALAEALRPHVDLLASAAYSRTFLDQLTQEAHALAAADTSPAGARERRSTHTAGIRRELARGMETIDVLEGVILRHIAEHGPVAGFLSVQSWREMRRVHGRVGRPPAPRASPGSAAPGTPAGL